MAASFRRWLLPKFGPDLSFKIDMDAIPALEAVRGRKADRTLKLLAAGILTIDEAREEIGYDPMTDSPDKMPLWPMGAGWQPAMKLPSGAPAAVYDAATERAIATGDAVVSGDQAKRLIAALRMAWARAAGGNS